MSYEIIYGLEAVKFTVEEIASRFGDDKYILIWQAGSSNCYETKTGRRSRDWSVAAVGSRWDVMGTMVKVAASCEGGMLKPFGRDCQAESFIRACRKALDNAVHGFDGAAARGLDFNLRLRFYQPDEYTSPADTRSDEWMVAELLKSRPMIEDQEYGSNFREFRFERSEASEWFKWANNRRGRHNAEVRGPRDPRPAQQELAFALPPPSLPTTRRPIMGADFIYAYVPNCELTEERKARLAAIIAGLTDEDVPDHMDPDNVDDADGNGDDFAVAAKRVQAWQKRLREAIEASDGYRRDVSTLSLPGAEYEVLVTGGLSWGEPPTDALILFGDLAECDPLYAELEEYAREDFLKARRAAAKESQLAT